MKILILELNSFTLTNVHKNLPAVRGVGEVGRDGHGNTSCYYKKTFTINFTIHTNTKRLLL